jgi:hypothetical protein
MRRTWFGWIVNGSLMPLAAAIARQSMPRRAPIVLSTSSGMTV